MSHRKYKRLVALVGRPNVGKSCLFNKMIRERKSFVYDEPGVTRDRIFGRAQHEGEIFHLCDTGGFEPKSTDNIKIQLVEQAELAIEEADVIILVVDGREGLHPVDTDLVRRLRKAGKSFFVCVNKCDLPADDYRAEEFRQLGVPEVFPVSAEHSRGIGDLLDKVVTVFKGMASTGPSAVESSDAVKLAIIGRPNVGKSSVLNRLAGEERSIVDDRPGTTRDAVDTFIRYHGREITVIDTAGIRRKSRMVDKIEKFSAFRSVACLEECDVAVLVINALDGVADGDLRVVGYAFDLRKPILIVVNKWDLIEDKDSHSTERFLENMHKTLRYLRYVPVIFTSALENLRVRKILPLCLELYDKGGVRHSTSRVNGVLREILVKHTPPLLKNRSRRVKFFYATQVGVHPPCFVIFCSHPQDIHFTYKRYVENSFREAFDYNDIPVKIVFRERTRKALGKESERKGDKTRSFFSEEEGDFFSEEFIEENDNVYEASDIEFSDDDENPRGGGRK